MDNSKIFIIGCGDIGARMARLGLEKGFNVFALSRTSRKCAGLTGTAATMLQGDLDDCASLPSLDLAGGIVIYTAPPPGGGIEETRVRNFLSTINLNQKPAKLIYVSTTSVYGDCGEELVSEERPPAPVSHAGKRRLHAELQFRAWGEESGVSVVVLRVAGIYGPGRIPMDRILGRQPILSEAEAGYTNRIHADDLASVCLMAVEKGENGDIFNVCDGEKSKMTDYFNAITDHLGLQRLPQVPLSDARSVMNPLMLSYMTESRLIDNSRMLAKLGIQLKYPTLMRGVENSLNQPL